MRTGSKAEKPKNGKGSCAGKIESRKDTNNKKRGNKTKLRGMLIALPVIAVLMIVICAVSYFADSQLSIFTFGRSKDDLVGPYELAWVTDGDTVRVKIEGETVTVRLIGIDTPESALEDESENTPEGKLAAERLKEILDGGPVWLEYGEELYDKYGRTLAYLYFDGGEQMAEDVLLKEGLAQTLIIEPNDKYADRFCRIEKEAKKAGAGFWGTGFFK